tara:strand:+ start:3324 stop:4055 length:732 start_codon:yes stop_codon:yes gene_type:complete
MPIVIPKKGFTADTPIDVNDMNENVEVFVQEIQGSLGEHNWAENAFNSENLEDGAILRAYEVRKSVNWNTGTHSKLERSSATSYVSGGGMPANGHKVSTRYEWETIEDMSVVFTAGNSVLWITFSCQIDFSSTENSYASGTAVITYGTGKDLPGLQVGIFIDGELVSETVTGAMDRSNDTRGEGHHFRRDPVAIDCVVPIAPGQHTVSARARMARHIEADKSYDSDTDFYAVFNRELFFLEMR